MAYEIEVPNFSAKGTALPSDKLSTGFLAGEKPPADWFNFLFYSALQAVIELQQKNYEKTDVDTLLGEKLAITDLAANTGTGTKTTMTQKAITEAINSAKTQIENKIPNISYGTSEPTGGSNGDIYIRYE